MVGRPLRCEALANASDALSKAAPCCIIHCWPRLGSSTTSHPTENEVVVPFELGVVEYTRNVKVQVERAV